MTDYVEKNNNCLSYTLFFCALYIQEHFKNSVLLVGLQFISMNLISLSNSYSFPVGPLPVLQCAIKALNCYSPCSVSRCAF